MAAVGKGFKAAAKIVAQATEAAVIAACVATDGQMSLNAPVRYGALRDSITWATKTAHSDPGPEAQKQGFTGVKHDGTAHTGIVGVTAHYGPHVEYGTAPHIIKPKYKLALAWPGAAHPVAVVHHPGTPPQPFVRPTVFQMKPKLPEIFTQQYRKSLEALR